MSIVLSICIPTYNRGRFIGEAIQSVIEQATEEVEIVVSDNASTDNTASIVSDFQQRFSRLRYFCWDQNRGFDRNVVKTVELAAGDYCWFVGSDDRVHPGGIKRVLEAINAYPGLGGLCVSPAEYDRELKSRAPRSNPTFGAYWEDKLFESADDGLAVLGYYLGQFCAQVISRQAALDVLQTGQWQDFCNGWVHLYLNASVLKQTQRWLFLYDECVDHRNGNISTPYSFDPYEEQEAELTQSNKALVAVLGHTSSAYRAIRRIGASILAPSVIATLKADGHMDRTTAVKFAKLYIRFYASEPSLWLKTLPLLFMPASFVTALRSAYRRLKSYNLKRIEARRQGHN